MAETSGYLDFYLQQDSSQRALSAIKDPVARRAEVKKLIQTRQRRLDNYACTLLQAELSATSAAEIESAAMTWFWANHFNVDRGKGLVGAALPDYVETAIRPNASGNFRNLLMATLTHPAMLIYLDNARNVSGHLNENYARELLELHTLGVNGGYTQADVQEVAKLLTGAGLNRPIRKPPSDQWAGMEVQRNGFRFDPQSHVFGSKRVLERSIEVRGFPEIEELVDLLAAHPATARHIAYKLSVFLLNDEPSGASIDVGANVFRDSGGDIKATVSAIRSSATPAASFKRPHSFVMTTARLFLDPDKIKNCRPMLAWMSSLGEPMFGCRTPDGYKLAGKDWVSPGQLAQRIALASEVTLLAGEALRSPVSAESLWTRESVQAFAKSLGKSSSRAIAQASDDSERLALLLSSPEFMYERKGI